MMRLAQPEAENKGSRLSRGFRLSLSTIDRLMTGISGLDIANPLKVLTLFR
jgi:hypothetical protein